jgi:hypothetical protein
MGAHSTNFFQKLIQIHKMWLKLAKIDRFSNFFRLFSRFQVVENIPDSFRMITFKNETFENKSKNLNFWSLFPILATIYEVKITF